MSTETPDTEVRRPVGRFGRRTLGLAAAGLLAIGAGAGAFAISETRPSVAMAPVTPVAIKSLASDGIVTVRGRVAEIYGNKFIMADASGRALVDTGREGDDRQLVKVGDPVTVQGRFDHGFVHAAFLVGADNKALALGPLGGPHHGRHGPHEGPGPDHGPDRDHDGPPPPPGDEGASPTAPPSGGGAPAAPVR
jgi:uncharacterized protein YdeI (BOF family)